MSQDAMAILIILALGVFAKNNSLAVAATAILGLKLLNLKHALILIEEHALKLGTIILTMGIIAPFATGKIALQEINETLRNTSSIVALLAGAITVFLAGRGTHLLEVNPSMVVGIIIGSLISIVFFKGVPIGPLTAAGIIAIIMNYIKH